MITLWKALGDRLDKTRTHKYVPCALEAYEERMKQ